MYSDNLKIITVYLLWIPFLLFLYINLGPYNLGLLDLSSGVAYGGDSGRYLRAAEQIILGNFPNYPEGVGDINNAQGYMTYNLFLTLLFLLRLDLFSVVIAQIVLSGIAALCLFKIGEIVWNKSVGIFAMILFLFYPSIQIYNFYILTESLFVNLTIIGFFFLIYNYKLGSIFLGVFILLLASFVRPFGIIIIPTAFIYLFILLIKFNKTKLILLFISISILAFVVTFFIIDFLVALLGVPELLLNGHIIWNYNILKPPYEVDQSSLNDFNTIKVLSFIIEYPIYFIEVFYNKLYWFFLRARPFYSDIHYYFLLISSLIMYIFFVFGFSLNSRRKEVIYLIIIYILGTTFSVLLTVVDWDARFSLPILPYIFLIASAGIYKLYLLFIKSIFRLS
tara:strand:+ start:1704 stop:2885 length:1182 start_codon:yes stop_codon:yes gene_type:complete